MRVEKKTQGKVLEAGAGLGWAGWLDSQRAPAVSGWRKGHVARASSGEASRAEVPLLLGYLGTCTLGDDLGDRMRSASSLQLATSCMGMGELATLPAHPLRQDCASWFVTDAS